MTLTQLIRRKSGPERLEQLVHKSGHWGSSRSGQAKVADAVKAGAVAMDLYGPEGWANMIDKDELNLSSMVSCIVGQTHDHDFSYGMDELHAAGLKHSAHELAFTNLDGYEVGREFVPAGTTKQLWLQEIDARVTKPVHATEDVDLAVSGD